MSATATHTFRPMLEVGPSGNWLRLTECLPETVRRRDELYNDYLLKGGVDDILGVRLFENSTHAVMLGVHQGIDHAPFAADRMAAFEELLEPLIKVARLHTELGSLGWEPAISLRALDQLAAAVIVADSDGRMIEMNRAAERVLQRDDGLTIRNGKLGALDVLDSARVEAVIAAAAAEQKTGEAIGRMRIRRHHGHPPYILTVAPLGADLSVYGRRLALIVVADPDQQSPSERDLAEFFGCHRPRAGSRSRCWRGKSCARLQLIGASRSRPCAPS